MESGATEIAGRLRAFRDRLRKAGVCATHQRLKIYQAVAASKDHPDVEGIYHTVRESLPTVSLDTVYRTLWMLLDLGLITTLGPPNGRLRFDGNPDSHHHFVCTRCGKTMDFYSPDLDRLRIPKAVQNLGKAEKTQVEVRGVCLSCSNQKNVNPKGALRNKKRRKNDG